MNRFGYPLPIEVAGWTYCDIRPFRPVNKVRSVLFGPIHPNITGWLPDVDKDLNFRTLERLSKYCKEIGAKMTVRYVRKLEEAGLNEIEGVTFVKANPDGSTDMIDRADLVVGHETFAYLSVARGKPTLMMGEDVVPHSGNKHFKYVSSWDKYRDIYMYPLDVLEGDLAEVVDRAIKSDKDIIEWRKNMIGHPFRPSYFVQRLESYL
jgi:hypothetical protein